jgi:hypothetical protein
MASLLQCERCPTVAPIEEWTTPKRKKIGTNPQTVFERKLAEWIIRRGRGAAMRIKIEIAGVGGYTRQP